MPLLLLYFYSEIATLQNPFFSFFQHKALPKSLAIVSWCKNTIILFHFFIVSGRQSVVAPFLPSGTSVLLGYKFMDLGSCSGGLNRRETALIFTLEDSEYVWICFRTVFQIWSLQNMKNLSATFLLKYSTDFQYQSYNDLLMRFFISIFRGNVLGRQVLQLRICTCPKRDMDQDEKNNDKQVSKNVLSNPRRLDPVSADKRQAFWVLVSDNLKLANKNATFARMLQRISN